MAAISLGSNVFSPGVGLTDANGKIIAINQRGLAILDVLLSAQGKTVSKSELMERVWPSQIVEEGNLTVQIATLRKVLGERPDGSEWIITVPRTGYRMVVGQASSIPATTAEVSAPLPEQPTLAVLPFQNLSGDPEQDYFADGIVEDIITALSRFKSFAVIARNSSFAYKGRAVDVRQVAKELGVRYVLEGSVRRRGSRLRINAQIADSESGAHLWAQGFDGTVEDIFDMQDRITESVVALVEPKIQRAEIERSRRERPESLDAYDLYLRALPDVFVSRPEANARAIALLERVIALDPNFAPGRAMAAQAYLLRVAMQFDGADDSDEKKAIAHARAALAITRDDPMVVGFGGFVLLEVAREYETGLTLLRLALSENPNSVDLLGLGGIGSLIGGDLTEGAEFLERALRLNPNGFGTHWQLTGMAHIRMAQGRYDEALDWAMRSQAINPGYDANHWMLIAANAYLGHLDEARKYLAALMKISPGVSLSRIRRGQKAIDPHRIDVLIEGMRLAGLSEDPPEAPILPSLAVLPFQNLSSDPEQDYFADGIVEDIITALSRFKSFAVIARNSSFAYKGRAVDVRRVATELGVRYVLEGSVRRAGNTLRISAKLIDAVRGAQLWAEKYEGTLEEVFAFQDKITESVIWLVEPKIQIAEIERSRRERPGSIAAYDLYLQTLSGSLDESADENAKSYYKLSQALALEPNNARFLSRAAFLLMGRNAAGYPHIGTDDIAKCAELARRGLEHAAGDGGVMAYCGIALIQTAKEYDYGMAVMRTAVEVNPNDFNVIAQMGVGCLHCGDLVDALTYFHRAIRLSPGDPLASLSLTGIAHAHMALGNYNEALDWATRSRVLSVEYDPAYWMLIAASAQLGRMDEARRFLKEYQRHAPGVTIASLKVGQPAKYPDRMANILEGLRLAGME
jgi:TolB-like protein/Tfp pilus assembly protein PilF